MKEKLLKKLNAVWQVYITREELAIKLKKQGLVLLDFPHSFYGLESLTSLNLPKNDWKSRLMNFWKK